VDEFVFIPTGFGSMALFRLLRRDCNFTPQSLVLDVMGSQISFLCLTFRPPVMNMEQFAILDARPEEHIKWKRFGRIVRNVSFWFFVNIPISTVWFGLVALYNYLVFVKLPKSKDNNVPGIGASVSFAIIVGLFNGGLTCALGMMNVGHKRALGIAFFVAAGVHWLLFILWVLEGIRWD